ncbi:alpha/beta hydrolase [Streptomyces morookaense]|uniref:alpha/beta hydrolase n=1 Tax=Streptomyces morookaense TaxID=1970 RepID=UPI0033CC9A7C
MTFQRPLLLTLSAAAVAAATLTAPATPAAASAPAPALSWHSCAGAPADDARECASLPVPLDYRDPDGEQIHLAVTRLRTDQPAHRRGTLLLVAGGPGGSGVDMVKNRAQQFRKETGGAYDIVGLDPRGTGGSSTADCGLSEDDRDMTNFRSWPAPDGSIAANVEHSRRIAAQCARNGGAVLRSMSTANEVRDIDRFRQALGERKLSAYGVSYGTYVAAEYAQKYPQHTGRWVLDSTGDPDPAHVERGWLANMAGGADDRFPDFAAWAAEHGIAERAEDVRPLFLSTAAKLDREPKTFGDGKLLTGNLLRQMLQNALYSDRQFQDFGELFRAAALPGRSLPMAYPARLTLPPHDAAVSMAVICNDVRWPRSVASYERAVAADRARHPLTAGMPANVTPCAFWDHDPADKPARITADGPSNVLMVQNLRDPATPYSGALKMRRALGDRARLVSVDAGGHGAYLANGNACGDRAVSRFLADGERPAGDVLCPKS